MKELILIIHVPVLHRGYIELFRRMQGKINTVLILGGELLKELRFFEADISSLAPEEAKNLVVSLGLFEKVSLLSRVNIEDFRDKGVVLISDELSRRFKEKFLPDFPVVWESVFLRWDESAVAKTNPVNFSRVSDQKFDQDILLLAYAEAEKSGDWWRRVGAILEKDGRVLLSAHNRDLPDEQSSYRLGNIRDFLKTGERPDLSNTIHAEARVIAEAARHGISTTGASLYVTHFPCPPCAKSIAASGIARCFFAEGSANFDAESVLKGARVEIVHVPVNPVTTRPLPR